jgi:cyanophycinase-like exopeptidase
MGGGTDVDEAFLWQIEKANRGDFVVLRATGTEAYNQWILDLSIAAGMELNSVRTILFNSKEASSEPEVLNLIRNAEAIFFAGGD